MLPYITVANRIIPLYGLCMALGVLCAGCVAFFRVKRAGGDTDHFFVIVACAVGCGLVGAKLLYVFVTYSFRELGALLAAGDLSFIMQGGLVFYGGLLGGIGGAFLGARIAKDKLPLFCDAIVPCVALGHCFGRVGCFFAGCCYGMPYEGPFCLHLTAAGIDHGTFPVQLLEAALNLALFFALCAYAGKHRGGFRVLFAYMIAYGGLRFALEFLRGDLIRGMAGGLSTSQWISLALCLFGTVMLVLASRREKDGAASGA